MFTERERQLYEVLRAFEQREEGAPRRAATSVAPAAAPSLELPAPHAPLELPYLTEEESEAVIREFNADPEGVSMQLSPAVDEVLSPEQVRAALEKVRSEFRAGPELTSQALDAQRALRRAANPLPSNFRFPAYTDAIPIVPADTQFETHGDLANWIRFTGKVKNPFWMAKTQRAASERFRRGEHAYRLTPPAGAKSNEPMRVALFADFGTGRYHSRFITHQLSRLRPHYAIHLGDVYYAGTGPEFDQYFIWPLEAVVTQSHFFGLAGNHELYSANIAYFAYLDKLRSAQPGFQLQEGSYFRLIGEQHQLIGLDTNSHQSGRYSFEELKAWLVNALVEGRKAGLTNILLSSEHPYDHKQPWVGQAASTPLYEDLRKLPRLTGEGHLRDGARRPLVLGKHPLRRLLWTIQPGEK